MQDRKMLKEKSILSTAFHQSLSADVEKIYFTLIHHFHILLSFSFTVFFFTLFYFCSLTFRMPKSDIDFSGKVSSRFFFRCFGFFSSWRKRNLLKNINQQALFFFICSCCCCFQIMAIVSIINVFLNNKKKEQQNNVLICVANNQKKNAYE